eukprot:5973048-Amphidinium_carterae.1
MQLNQTQKYDTSSGMLCMLMCPGRLANSQQPEAIYAWLSGSVHAKSGFFRANHSLQNHICSINLQVLLLSWFCQPVVHGTAPSPTSVFLDLLGLCIWSQRQHALLTQGSTRWSRFE